MLELAARQDDPQPVRLKALAEGHAIPQRFLVQILLQLKASGLVVSTRGAAGGYRLSRPPSQIALADVIGIIDRTGPAPPDGAHVSSTVAVIRSVWRQIQIAQERILTATTLAELLERIRADAAHVYQI
jgi:Rrf2 family protein